MKSAYLNQARAFWRVAAKFRKQGKYAQAAHYEKIAELRYAQYARRAEFMKARTWGQNV